MSHKPLGEPTNMNTCSQVNAVSQNVQANNEPVTEPFLAQRGWERTGKKPGWAMPQLNLSSLRGASD